jgi:hypothetical protein
MEKDLIKKQYKNKIKIIPDAINTKDAKEITDFIDKYQSDKTKFNEKIGFAHKKGVGYRAIFPDRKAPNLFKEIEDVLTKYSNFFIEQCKNFYKNENIYFYGYSITRLEPGIQLRLHQDIHESKHGEIIKLSHSASLYLNDGYDGGDIVFLNDFKSNEDFPLYEDVLDGFVYDQKKHEMVIFPAELWHATDLLKNGTRDALIFWATSNKEHEFKGFDSDFVWNPL